MSAPQSGELDASRWLESRIATLEGVQAALSGPGGAEMGFPGALDGLADLAGNA
jgi:hypothetical protein